MKTIPEDIIADILSRLPVKDVLRYKRVSKPWKTLIKSPIFIKLHLNQTLKNQPSNLSLIINYFDLYSVDFTTLDHPTKLNPPLHLPFWGTEIAGSCHGVLCVTLKIKVLVPEPPVALFNPCTKTHRILPVSPVELPACEVEGDRRVVEFGFGYDRCKDDYKVVRIAQFCGCDSLSFSTEVKVYSLKKNVWNKVEDIPYYLKYKDQCGFLVNEILHWPVIKNKYDFRSLIMSYDLKTEKCNLVSQPNYPEKGHYSKIFSVLDGCLAMTCNYLFEKCDVWVMKEYGVKGSWVKLFSIKQEEVSTDLIHVKPVGFLRDDPQRVWVVENSSELILYDLEWKRGDIVRVPGLLDGAMFEIEVCLRTLVSLDSDDGSCGVVDLARGCELSERKNTEQKYGKKRNDFLSQGFKLKL